MQAYYVLAGLYGWLVWRRRGRKTDAGLTGPEDAEGAKRAAALRIGHTPLRTVPALAGVYAAAHIGLYLLLTRFTDSTVPFWDAGTTALSVVAMWMLSRKLVEQWLVWLVVDLAVSYTHLDVYKRQEEKQVRKYWKGQNPAILRELRDVLTGIDDFSLENTERIVHAWIEEKGYGMGQVMNTLRLALVGAGKGPGMYDVTSFIGKEECLKRIDNLLTNLKPAIE